MIYTSYYSSPVVKRNRDRVLVSISRTSPMGWGGNGCFNLPYLAPTPSLLSDYKRGLITWSEYRARYYNEVLYFLDSSQVLYTLHSLGGCHDVVLLCWERDSSRCHRRLLAKWLEDDVYGLSVPELSVTESPAVHHSFARRQFVPRVCSDNVPLPFWV